MLIVAIFVLLIFIYVVLQKCYHELKEIKDILRTKQLTELNDRMSEFDEKEAETK